MFKQRLQPGGFALGLFQPRLGGGRVGFSAGDAGLERRGIDGEQGLPGLDLGAFNVVALEQNAGYPGTHLNLARAERLRGVFERQR